MAALAVAGLAASVAGAKVWRVGTYNGVGGQFTSISGAPRKYLAAIDGRSGAVTDWNPAPDSEVDMLLATPAGLVVSGQFETIGHTNSDGLAIFPTTP